MNHVIILCAALLAVAACTPAQKNAAIIASGAAANVAVAAMSPEQVAMMRAKCAEFGPALEIATALGMPAQLRDTALYPLAFCQAIDTGQAQLLADSNSPAWWAGVIAELPAIARAAGVILPLLF